MTAMEEDVDDRFAGIDIDSLLNRAERRPYVGRRKKTLYEAPEFIQRLCGEETVMEGQSLCIETKVRGFPAPTLRWFKDDEEILDHPRIHVESNGAGGYFLYIDNVQRGDEAAYRCRAENVEGACSSYFFLSVKSKPKSNKKKDAPNRRTVSFPPMFSTIVEKVEEEEKQGKELELLPPSPMTEFYYALTLKGRQTWPAFLGDWAFANGGHRRRTDDDEEEDDERDSGPGAIPNGDVHKKNLSPCQQRQAARRSLRRSDLAAREEAKRQRLDEEAKGRSKEDDKRTEEEKWKQEEELKMNIESQRKEEARRRRRQERAERMERETKAKEEEERVKKEQQEDERRKAVERVREEEKAILEKRREEERKKQEEEKKHQEESKIQDEEKKKEADKKKEEADENRKIEEKKRVEDEEKRKAEEKKRKEEEERRKLEEKKRKEEEEQKRKEAEKRREEDLRKRREAQELEKKQREEKEREKRQLEERRRKQEQEEKAKKEEERKRLEAKTKEEEEKKKKEAALKAEADKLEKQRAEAKKKNEERLKLEKERKEEERNQIGKPGQKNVLQKFAKHLEPAEQPEPAKSPKLEPKALHVFQDKVDRLSPNRFGDMREKSPSKVEDISQRLSPNRLPASGKFGDMKEKSPSKLEERLSPNRLPVGSKFGDMKEKSPSRVEDTSQRLSPNRPPVSNKFGDMKEKSPSKVEDVSQRLSPNRLPASNKFGDMKEKSPSRVEDTSQRLSPNRPPVSSKFGDMKEKSPSNVEDISQRLSPNRQPGGNKFGDMREKSPSKIGEISQRLQGSAHGQQQKEKSGDIPKPAVADRVSARGVPETKTPEPKEEKDSNLKPWQRRDNLTKKEESAKPVEQKTEAQKRLDDLKLRDQKRLEELRQKDQQRLEELKKEEQKRMEDLKKKDQKMYDLKRRESNQRESLKEKEQRQREELRRKEQEQREALRQREQKQLQALREKEQKKKEDVKPIGITNEKVPPKPAEKGLAVQRLKAQREEMREKEAKQMEELKLKEMKQNEQIKIKERKEREELRVREERERAALKAKEEKQKEELRLKQQRQKSELEKKKEEEERKKREAKEEQTKEELRLQYRKEQMRKEQLRRQHDEELKKRQQKQKEEEEKRAREKRERDRQRALQQAEEEEEFQVKVYKRDYSFADLRKSLEAHVGGNVMDAEEHKYWDEILEKHHCSISDIKKAFDIVTAEDSGDRQPRMRQRRNSIGEEEIQRMKRSSSVSDIRESYTNSLGRPKKKDKEAEPRPKEVDYVKKSSSINDLRKQFAEVMKKKAEVAKSPAFSGKSEAEITINRLKPEVPEVRRRSISPASSRHSPSPSPFPATSSQNQQENRPTSRTYSELSKVAAGVAAKRASFYDLMNQGPSIMDKAQKRMSFQGRDAYGSREIPTYKRAANWSDDVEKPLAVKNPDKPKALDLKPKPTKTEKEKEKETVLKDESNQESSSGTKVRPFIYNSARTIARHSTGSITSDSYMSSSEEDVFSDEEREKDTSRDDEEPPSKQPKFYIEEDTASSSESDMSPIDIPSVYNTNNILSVSSDSGYTSADAAISHSENNINNNIGSSDNQNDNSTDRKPEAKITTPYEDTKDINQNREVKGTKRERSAKENGTTEEMASNTKHEWNVSVSIDAPKEMFEDDTAPIPSEPAVKRQRRSKDGDAVTEMVTDIDEAMEQEADSHMTVRCINVISPEPDSQGDITPPIIVELWEDKEQQAKVYQYPANLSDTQQPSLTPSEQSREEREPTPFFKENMTAAKDNRHGHSLLSVDGKGESATSYTTDKVNDKSEKAPSGERRSRHSHVSRRDATEEERKEFRRSPTPFFDKTTKQLAAQGVGLLGSGEGSGKSSGRSTHGKDGAHGKDGTHRDTSPTSPTFLTVPGGEGLRTQRESTPYYDEEDPYEFIHHPDHHFQEKKASVLKQRSLDDDRVKRSGTGTARPQLGETGRSSSDPVPAKKSVAAPKTSGHRHPPQSLSLKIPPIVPKEHERPRVIQKAVASDDKTEEKLKNAERSKSSETIEAQAVKTVEVSPKQVNEASSPMSPTLTCQFAPSLTKLDTRELKSIDKNKSQISSQVSSMKQAQTGLPGESSKVSKLPAPVEQTAKPSTQSSAQAKPHSAQKKADQSSQQIKAGVANAKNQRSDQGKAESSAKTSSERVRVKSPQGRPESQSVQKSGQSKGGEAPKQAVPITAKPDTSTTISKTSQSKIAAPAGVTTSGKSDKAKEVGKEGKPVSAPVSHGNDTPISSSASISSLPKPQTTPSMATVPPTAPPSGVTQTKAPILEDACPLRVALPPISTTAQTTTATTTSHIQKSDITTLRPKSVASGATASRTNITLPSATASVVIPPTKRAPLAVPETLTPEMPRSARTTGKSKQTKPESAQKVAPPPHRQEKQQQKTTSPLSVEAQKSPSLQTSFANQYPDNKNLRAMTPPTVTDFPMEHPITLASTVRMSPTPPAETMLKKRDTKSSSGLTGALSSLLKPKRGVAEKSEDEKPPAKEKRRKSKDRGKHKRKRSSSAGPGETTDVPATPRPLTAQDLTKCSPFGRYTLEGCCFLFVLTMICLQQDMHVEKFVFYVLASFYTFCVLRILGLVD